MESFSNYRPVCESKSINNDQTRAVPVEYNMITFVPHNRRLKLGCNRCLSTRISNKRFICGKWRNLKRIIVSVKDVHVYFHNSMKVLKKLINNRLQNHNWFHEIGSIYTYELHCDLIKRNESHWFWSKMRFK